MIFPDKATMYISAIEDGDYKEEKVHYWDNVYGFDYSSIKSIVMKEPLVDIVDGNNVMSTACPFKEIDIATVTKADLNFKAPFKITATRDDMLMPFLFCFILVLTIVPSLFFSFIV